MCAFLSGQSYDSSIVTAQDRSNDGSEQLSGLCRRDRNGYYTYLVRETNRNTDRKSDRQTDTQTGRQTLPYSIRFILVVAFLCWLFFGLLYKVLLYTEMLLLYLK